MNASELNSWISPVGWTLLHSLWQGLLVFIVFIAIRKIFPKVSSSFRYMTGAVSLAFVFIFLAGTFIYESGRLAPVMSNLILHQGSLVVVAATNNITDAASPGILFVAGAWINEHLFAIVIAWLAGATFFGFRLLMAWILTIRLQHNAIKVQGPWHARMLELAEKLNLATSIILAECKSVKVPVVLGYLRPVILVPIGMLSALPPDMVETILLHELAHIKRHDYFINILQCLLEVVLFFNPFVWIISSELRNEREQCCDDVVVSLTNPYTYARALHQLEEDRLSGTTIAMAATGNKNQLLQRIKRIMEPSEKKNFGSRKMLPATIMIITLLAASWISVKAYLPPDSQLDLFIVKSDTAIKDSLKVHSSGYSRKTVITVDRDGTVHKVVTDVKDGEEDMADVNVEIDPIAEMEPMEPMEPMVTVEPFLGMEALETIAPEPFAPLSELMEMPGFPGNFNDTIPGEQFQWQNEKEWELFSKKFTEEFSEKFSEFYEKNGEEINKMMKELELKMEKAHEGLADVRSFEQNDLLREQMMQARKQAEIAFHNASADKERALRLFEIAQENHELSEATNDAFNEKLAAMLVKDGYMKKVEKITQLQWNSSGAIINGRKIKEKDALRYKALEEVFKQQHNEHNDRGGAHVE